MTTSSVNRMARPEEMTELDGTSNLHLPLRPSHPLGVGDDVLSRENRIKEKGIRSYREFIREEEEEINAAIRRATSTGRPLDGEWFIRKLEKRLNRDLFPKKGGRPKGKRKK
jgi:hypothetical protein